MPHQRRHVRPCSLALACQPACACLEWPSLPFPPPTVHPVPSQRVIATCQACTRSGCRPHAHAPSSSHMPHAHTHVACGWRRGSRMPTRMRDGLQREWQHHAVQVHAWPQRGVCPWVMWTGREGAQQRLWVEQWVHSSMRDPWTLTHGGHMPMGCLQRQLRADLWFASHTLRHVPRYACMRGRLP